MKSPQWNSLWAAVSLLTLLASSQSAQAASATWNSGAGNWNDGTKWSTNPTPPGATSGTTNTDTATFNSATAGTVTVDSGRNIQNIAFAGTAGAFTLSSGSLLLTGGGSISNVSGGGTATQTVNSPITLEGDYSFINNFTTSTRNLNFGSAATITTAATSGTTTLTLDGVNTGSNTISGVISDNGSGKVAITKQGVGNWVLSNTDTYSGATTIDGGILTLSGTGQLSNSAVTANNGQLAITDTASGSITRAGNVTLNGGAVQVTGTASGSTTDTISTLTLAPGAYTTDNLGNTSSTKGVGNGNNTIYLVPNAAANSTLVIGNLVTTTGGTVEFLSSNTLGGGTIGTTVNDGDVQINAINGGTVAAALVGGGGAIGTNTTSILPFAVGASANSDVPTGLVTYTANGVQLLTTFLAGGTTNSVLNPISGTTTFYNANLTVSDSLTSASGTTTINSLSFNGQSTLTFNSQTLKVTSGALFFGAANNNVVGATTNSGTIQLGTGGPAFIQLPQTRIETFNAAITGPGLSSGVGSLTISGAQSGSAAPATIIFAGANSYTGGTIVNGGSGASGAGTGVTLQIGGSSTTTAGANGQLGSGNVVLNNASLAFALTVNQTVSNAISGSGTVQLRAADTGKITLSSTTGNTYSGGTTVNAGTLAVTNTSGSATGSGALSVARGAALAGTGTSSGSSFAIGGTTGSGTANVYVGQTAATGDTNTTNKLTLLGSGASTIANANLTFNLDTTSPGGSPGLGNELLVGGTAITFGSGTAGSNPVTLTLNLQGGQNITNVPYFVLIAGTVGTPFTSQYSGLSLGTSFSADGGTLTPILNSNVGGSGNLILALNLNGSTFYAGQGGLYLYQTSGGIDDIVVIPEPGTWALMLGGLALLVVIQRSRRKKV